VAVQNFIRIYFDDKKTDYKEAVMARLKGISALASKLAPSGKFVQGPLYIFPAKAFSNWNNPKYFTKPVKLQDKEVSAVNKDQNVVPTPEKTEPKKEQSEDKSDSGKGKK